MRSRAFTRYGLPALSALFLLLAPLATVESEARVPPGPSGRQSSQGLNNNQIVVKPMDGTWDPTKPARIIGISSGIVGGYAKSAASFMDQNNGTQNGNDLLLDTLQAWIDDEQQLSDILKEETTVSYAVSARSDKLATVYTPDLLISNRSPNFDVAFQPILGTIEGYSAGLRVPLLPQWQGLYSLPEAAYRIHKLDPLREILSIYLKLFEEIKTSPAFLHTFDNLSIDNFYHQPLDWQDRLASALLNNPDFVVLVNDQLTASDPRERITLKCALQKVMPHIFNGKPVTLNTLKVTAKWPILLFRAVHQVAAQFILGRQDTNQPLDRKDIRNLNLPQLLHRIACEYVAATMRPVVSLITGYDNARYTGNRAGLPLNVVTRENDFSYGLSAGWLRPFSHPSGNGFLPVVTVEQLQSNQIAQIVSRHVTDLRWAVGLVYQDKVASVEPDQLIGGFQTYRINRWTWQVGLEYRGRNAADGPDSYQVYYRYRDIKTYFDYTLGVGKGADNRAFIGFSIGQHFIPRIKRNSYQQ